MAAAYAFFVGHWGMIGGWVLAHIKISVISIGISTPIAVVLGIYITGEKRERIADAVLYLTEVMMTIPSLALFGIFMILLGWLGLNAIGLLPAVITLVIYGQLPVVRNTYTSIRGVDPAMLEAGRGMGMSDWQLLYRVKLPLALPVIMAGLRNAMVLIIGIATIAALIGAGGLGVPIFRGLRNARMDLIIVGGSCVSALAVLADWSLALLERLVTPRGLRG